MSAAARPSWVWRKDRQRNIRLASGEAIYADLVLVGIGAQPNVALAERAGPCDRQRHRRQRPTGNLCSPTSTPPAIAAPFRWRFMAGGEFAWNPGAMRRSREHWPQPICSAQRNRFRPCRGSGRINTTDVADRRPRRWCGDHAAPRSRRGSISSFSISMKPGG